MLSQFQAVGQALFTQGLVSSQGGNLSIKLGEHLVITHRGSALGSIQEGDLVETGINKNNRVTPLASKELEIHRCIYKNTSALAVVHAHPPYAVALSFTEEEIVPCDLEGQVLLSKVPVLSREAVAKLEDLAGGDSQVTKRIQGGPGTRSWKLCRQPVVRGSLLLYCCPGAELPPPLLTQGFKSCPEVTPFTKCGYACNGLG